MFFFKKLLVFVGARRTQGKKTRIILLGQNKGSLTWNTISLQLQEKYTEEKRMGEVYLIHKYSAASNNFQLKDFLIWLL